MNEKKYCDEGKYAAPRWLVYPELSSMTIGWRMGYGEDYRMNEPPRSREFFELFPQPLNWLFQERKSNFKIPAFMAFLWRDYGEPKYSEIGDDRVIVNDFITMTDEKEFRVNALRFSSIEYMLLYSRYLSVAKDRSEDIPIEALRRFQLPDKDRDMWEAFKYTVCLNACYYKIMQDEELKSWLLSTGDKSLAYDSDDEWGGDTNLFGFALMEVRDEIRRLTKNIDLIDWEYTEYLKHAYPYVKHDKNPLDDPQSPEYNVVRSVFSSSRMHVRDVNLDEKLADKYEVGQIITERAFVDASSRIGGMVTSHRYLIFSQFMADLSKFEKDTNWGLHTANKDSRFKVIDIFTHDGKTQIALLQLPDGFEGVFNQVTDIEEQYVKRSREEFIKALEMDVIPELAEDIWLERCSFPLGMSDDGEFF